ncbi:hybrid sensor histidine kinase/response regulator [Sphingomonas bacterium]|uniref:hybrid sensor histidine kinase/response regulator n=1 Tax=Sphingomonas bacterium TaxID=1895847 RepID=UPI0015776F5B|nr:ATP-binding protein [Sphingomonas bacterium]
MSLPLAVPSLAPFPAPLPASLIFLAGVAVPFVLLHKARRGAEGECRRQTRMLEDEIVAHRRTHDELGRAKEAAEAANAAKTRYLVAVSHEIRSPLNAIYGYAQLLEREDAIPPAEAGGVIRRSSEHLTNLVEGLLDISRIESGVLQFRRDTVRLPALLDHIVDMFRMQAAAKNLTLDYTVDGMLPPFVRTDEKRLRQILINLLSNAIKYTQAGGAALTVRYRSQTAQIDVTDTGIGIAPEDMERIFEPFERGTSPDAAMQPGIGLGLAITRVLAGILGGEVTATSEVGRGSSFRLRMLLPEPMDAPASAPTHDRLVGYRGERRTILVIDDNAAQLVVVQHLLRPLDFHVFAATGGADGLALARRCTPDLVLLDVQLPGCSGWEIAARLRAMLGRAPRIVMVSANAHEYRAGGDGESDHDAFVSKPVDLDALLDTIGRQLGIDWIAAADESVGGSGDGASGGGGGGGATLPDAAAPYLETMRRHVKVGHVRAIATVLDDLEAGVPGSGGAVAEMRRMLENFDLRALARRIDDVA